VATVHLPSGLTQFTGGVAIIELDAGRVKDVLDMLAALYPALQPQLDEMAVAIDGEIYQQPGYQALNSKSEVHLVPRIAGG
jgi:molybdopterin synthase sulfur carrier subunit